MTPFPKKRTSADVYKLEVVLKLVQQVFTKAWGKPTYTDGADYV